MRAVVKCLIAAVLLLAVVSYTPVALSSNQSLLIDRVNVYVVLAGLGHLAYVVSNNLSLNYEVKLPNSWGLKLLIRLHVIILRNASVFARIARKDSILSKRIPEFITQYLRCKHPEWRVRRVELVRADAFENDAWSYLRTESVIPDNADYVLLIFYAPPSEGLIRTYYVESYVPGAGRLIKYVGMICFGGNNPLYFIDLSAVPKPWPSKTQPGYEAGVKVNVVTDPPLWDAEELGISKASELIKHYVEGYVGFLVCRALFTDGRLPWSPRYLINVTILNFGGGKYLRDLLSMLNKYRLEALLHSLMPYSSWGISVRVVNGNSTVFSGLIPKALPGVNGSLAINCSEVLKILNISSVPHVRVVNGVVEVPAYIFVASKPLYLTFGKLNFTGIADLGKGVVLTFPGYCGRMYELGVNVALAHEVGHMLGLPHPFDRMVSVDHTYPPGGKSSGYARWWLFDFTATPMSYAPSIAGWDGGVFYYDAKSLGRYLAAELIQEGIKNGVPPETVAKAEALLSMDKVLGPEGAVEVMINALKGLTISPVSKVVTVTSKSTVTSTATLTSIRTAVKTETVTVTHTVTATKTTVSTVTATVIKYSKTNSYVTTSLAAALAFMVALTVTLLARRR